MSHIVFWFLHHFFRTYSIIAPQESIAVLDTVRKAFDTLHDTFQYIHVQHLYSGFLCLNTRKSFFQIYTP